MSTDKNLPGTPDVPNPQHETPVTELFETGTANDPDVGTRGEESTTLTVDGRDVTVPPGSTIIDALRESESITIDTGAEGLDDGGLAVSEDADIAALCYFDRTGDCSDEIGPRSECRTCMVETDEHGLVPACSFPAEDGLTVRVNSADAAQARSVNLDLVLSNHNLRCTTCNGNGRCELQKTSIEQDVEHPRYGVFDERDQYEPIDDTSSFIQIDRNKCILCNRCVEGCNDVQVEGVLRIEGSGEDTRIGFQSDAETMADSTCVSCGHCSTVCPTGALTEKDIGGVTTLPIPGFSQRNSVGTVLEHESVETLDDTTAPNRSFKPTPEMEPTASDRTEAASTADIEFSLTLSEAKERAKLLAAAYGRRATLLGEHTAENVAAKMLPEGLLFDIASLVSKVRMHSIRREETTCGFCSVGCRFEMWGKGGDTIGVEPVEDPDDAPANNFSTCVKGKFGHEFANSENRLTQPLVRNDDGELEEVPWEEVLDLVADRLSEIQERHGTDSVGCLASSKGTNEEAYLVQRFAREVLGTKNIDNCARLCHSSTVAALQRTVGFGAMTNRINEDVGEADAYLLTGSNTTESHPVLATRIKQNVRDGADLVVFDPRKIGIAEHADQFTRIEPGFDTAWINGLIRYIIENDLHDEAFIERNTKGFEDVKEKVQPFTPEKVEELSGVPPEELESAAETLAAAEDVIIGWAMGITQSSHGTENVLALADLALVLGQLGKRGAGLSPFRGQNNVQGGGGDMGTLPGSLPGYQDVTDEDVLDKFERAWEERPPNEPGLKVPQMFDEIHEENLRGMYVVGENPALSEPDIEHAAEGLEKLDFLVVQDIFLTETAEYADVVLPAAASPEKHGTFTNTERRIQRVRPVSDPPGEARQDWEILMQVANRLGYGWEYDHPREVMSEINGLAPIYGGVTYDRLEAGEEHGLQWPCWDEDHPGTPYLYDYEDGEFNFEDGKARFVPADVRRPGEETDEAYPLTLTSGRVLYHWHTGQITRRVEGLMSHVGESFVEIHPDTATEVGIEDEEYVRVESRRSEIVVKAQVTDRVGRGTLFIPMHFAAGAVNKLTQESFDPQAGIPEYKVTSVRIEPLGPDTDEQILQTPDVGFGEQSQSADDD